MPIIAAVDRSEQAADIVTEAADLALAFEEPIHVVHVMTQSEFVEMAQSNVDDTGTALDMERVRETAAGFARDAADGLEYDLEAVGLVGKPAERVVDYATDHDARYVVTGARKRSPAGKAIFGSTSQSIILDAPCPVVVAID